MSGTSSFPSNSTIWAGIGNKPEYVTEAAEEERQAMMLAFANDIVQLKAAQSLNIDTFDGLFVDPFVDEDNIASKTGVSVTTGTNGNLQLPTTTVTVPDPNLNYQESTSYGQEIQIKKDIDGIVLTLNYGTSPDEVGIADTSGNKIVSDTSGFSGGDTITFNESFSAGTTVIPYVYAGGSDYSYAQYDSPSFPYSSDVFDVYEGKTDVLSGGVNTYDVAMLFKSYQALGKYLKAGSISSTSWSVDTVPDTIQIYQQATLNGQDIAYTVKDGNGNTETISQSQIGESVTVNFTGTNLSTDVDFTGDGTDTPVLDEYGVNPE